MNPTIYQQNSLFLGTPWHAFSFLEKIAIFFIIITPFFYLSIPHWITNTSVLASIFSIAVLIKNRKTYNFKTIKNLRSIILLFSIYPLAIIISQIGRGNFIYSEYLDQTRWLIGFPFFLCIYFLRINYTKVLDWAAPIGIIAAWISSTYIIPSNAWGSRATISFMDPLAFGFINLALALMCFASSAFDIKNKSISFNTYLKIVGFFIGLYLSIRSGSRSGWGAFPLVIFFVLYILYKPKFKNVLLMLAGIFCIALAFYQLSTLIHGRINELINELLEYPWTGGLAPDTSVGMRVTFYRLGSYYFSQNPWFGWGERGYTSIKDAAPLLTFSSQVTRDFAYVSLFHSEWTTQAVRFGVLGLFGVFWVFFVPIKLFLQMSIQSHFYKKSTCMGIAYVICLLVASVGDEVFSSKGMITFAAVIIAGLISRPCISD